MHVFVADGGIVAAGGAEEECCFADTEAGTKDIIDVVGFGTLTGWVVAPALPPPLGPGLLMSPLVHGMDEGVAAVGRAFCGWSGSADRVDEMVWSRDGSWDFLRCQVQPWQALADAELMCCAPLAE